ncbi:uncharacterized protein LOC119871823 isoform X2 [Canis lupus familiaris]|nr:uncharacterized protein LOC119871823 isoform X2 [Canis lupus familiaris]XP_038520963.1 uncharacterized protein LOC119871823 isoform X2 [Canis lupus familiaris]
MGCAKSRRMLVLRETVLVCRSVGAPGGNGVLERSGWWKAGGGREGRRRANWREAQVHETCSSRTCCDGGHVWCPVRRLLTMWLSSISNVASTNVESKAPCDEAMKKITRLATEQHPSQGPSFSKRIHYAHGHHSRKKSVDILKSVQII